MVVSLLAKSRVSEHLSVSHIYSAKADDGTKYIYSLAVNYTEDTLREIAAQGFQYDTSATGVVDDCYW